MRTTFTVLVTIEHDSRPGYPDHKRVAEIIQTALEEGTSCSGSFLSAQVDAFQAVRLSERSLVGDDRARFERILPLHI